MENHVPFSLPPLPYPYHALEPEIDARTLRFHHDKHFAAYVDNLNALLRPYPAYHSWTLEQLCMNWTQLPEEIRTGVRNNAGGVYNHGLYFQRLQPLPPNLPLAPLEKAIQDCFGSMEELKGALKTAAAGVFGSGWAWLTANPSGALSIQKTANQDTVLPLIPLLCCDVWEHAYYLQYQNRRADYFEAWWRLVDWPQVSACYEAAKP